MRLARWIFAIAAIWGFVVVAPLYFLEAEVAELAPPAISHPELYYGFAGVTLAWQLVYALIAFDPPRYRPLMLVGALSKLSFFGACLVLFLQGRVTGQLLGSVAPDLILAGLFVAAWVGTRHEEVG